MTFGRSAFLEDKFSNASVEIARVEIQPLVEILSGTEQDVRTLCEFPLTIANIRDLAVWNKRLSASNPFDTRGLIARRFWASQILASPVCSKEALNRNFPHNTQISNLLKVGAEALYEFGNPQFVKLAELVSRILNWLEVQSIKKFVVLECPLGNSIPVQVLVDSATKRGIEMRSLQWNVPRNDSKNKGRTVFDAANDIANQIHADELVIYLDDALTGTRFIKIYDALNKALQSNKLLAVAMQFIDLQLTITHSIKKNQERLIKRLKEHALKTKFQFTYTKFPVIQTCKVEIDYYANWESPVIWGDVDLVAGKRKVNLIFNLLDFIFIILNDLTLHNSQFASFLINAWKEDTDGNLYQFAPGSMSKVFKKLIEKINMTELEDHLKNRAIDKFKCDYYGDIDQLDESGISERWMFLKTEFQKFAKTRISEHEANFLWRAFDSTFASSIFEKKIRSNRDHSYASYAIPYNSTISSFNIHLRKLIINNSENF